MFGVTEAELAPIQSVASNYFRDANLSSIGPWCTLPLFYGMAYGGTFSGKSALIEGINGNRDAYLHSRGMKSETSLAWEFSELLKEWSSDSTTRALARNRLKASPKEATPEAREDAIPYFTLGIMLSSVGSGDNRRLLNEYWDWIDSADGSWLQLFFASGMLLREDEDFPGPQIHRTLLRITPEPFRTEVVKVLDHFRAA